MSLTKGKIGLFSPVKTTNLEEENLEDKLPGPPSWGLQRGTCTPSCGKNKIRKISQPKRLGYGQIKQTTKTGN